ncbi:hypothetical protein TIFTF001_007409 [Ficus carica]|uniref:Uncharacterized protein n=1 Tax=Ficus carica TaxID=3494 RepID=A0AA88D0V4_FICCA|nr:hypothetical protein TIFTF001_007409 [Ficus carica]
MSPYHPNGRAHGIRLVEVKYPYTRSMSTCRDHSECDPSGSPEDPDPWEMPINKEVPHSLR